MWNGSKSLLEIYFFMQLSFSLSLKFTQVLAFYWNVSVEKVLAYWVISPSWKFKQSLILQKLLLVVVSFIYFSKNIREIMAVP